MKGERSHQIWIKHEDSDQVSRNQPLETETENEGTRLASRCWPSSHVFLLLQRRTGRGRGRPKVVERLRAGYRAPQASVLLRDLQRCPLLMMRQPKSTLFRTGVLYFEEGGRKATNGV